MLRISSPQYWFGVVSSSHRPKAGLRSPKRNLMFEVPNIALRAYELWDAAGRPEGRSEEFYFQAEEEFRKLLESESPKQADDS
jgi:hypothetical protein